MNNLWTYAIDDEMSDEDFMTSAECITALDEDFAELTLKDNDIINNGEEFGDVAEIVRFKYNDDEEREIIFSEEVVVKYQHYHGDLKEHGTY